MERRAYPMAKFLDNDALHRALMARLPEAEGMIRTAFYDFHVYPQRITNPAYQVLGKILERAGAGVRIRFLLPTAKQNSRNARAAHWMKLHGVTPRLLPPGIRLHAKMIVIDRSALIVGSANLSYASFARNHEAGALLTDREQIVLAVQWFDNLWRSARPLN